MRRWRPFTAAWAAWVLSIAAFAAGEDSGSIPWSELELTPSAQETRAIGPDLLAAGPEGRIAIWNPAEALVHVHASVDAALAGVQPTSFAIPTADDLAWSEAGLLVLDEARRQLDLYAPAGQRRDSLLLPGLVPVGVHLYVQGGVVYAVDVFSNRRPVARVSEEGLSPVATGRLEAPAVGVRWDAGSHTMTAGGRKLHLPEAIKAGGRVLSGGGRSWLVVDTVVGDRPLRVSRRALCLDTGATAELPASGRLYAPSTDVAVDARGYLIWMAPMADGLHLGEVSP